MDRGFFDGEWITFLKKNRGIDICIPLKKNFELSELIRWNTLHGKDWKNHPTRDNQIIRELAEDEFEWKKCSVFKSGVLIKYKKKNGEDDFITIVDTRKGLSPNILLETYDLRSEIEESHRQMKCFQGLEKLPSKKYTQVVFRVIMGLIGYNLFNLFLNSEGCANYKDFTLKLFRQKRKREEGENPDIIIYTKTNFAVVKAFRFFHLILGLSEKVRKKLQNLFEELSVMSEDIYCGPSP